ncbi:MAG: hypothetical protein ACOVJ8_08485 [Sediminibacterium sp.]
MNPIYAKMIADKMAGGNTKTGLPSWAKGVIAVALVGVGVIVIYKVYKLIEGTDRKEVKNADDVVKEQEKEIKDLINKGETPSKPLSSYKSAANTIFAHLDGCETLETEIKVIQEVVKQVKKPIDWKLLSREFGTKKVDNCGWGTGETPYELGTLLKEQLDAPVANPTTVVAEGFAYIPLKSGRKTTFEVLNTYLKSIGVTI